MKKETLTIEMIKQQNKSSGNFGWILIPPTVIFIAISLISIFNTFKDLSGPMILFPIAFISIPFMFIILIFKHMKKEKKENEYIDAGNFKLVEDVIYDKCIRTRRDKNGDVHYHHYIFSKIYGEVEVSSSIYDDALRDDLVYLLFYNSKETENKYSNIEEEKKRNRENIDQEFLEKHCTLSPELSSKLISYNESMGEANFNSRIKNSINALEANANKVQCKKCGKKYNLRKFNICPDCNTLHKFDITDVVHEKEWYI